MAANLSFRFMSEQEIRTWVLANPEHVNEKDSYMNTLLYNAVSRGAGPEYISWLLERGYDVDNDGPGLQPICITRSVAVLSVLLENGANPLKKDFLGRTALVIHAQCASADCVERLLQIPRVRGTIDMVISGFTCCKSFGGAALHRACWSKRAGAAKTRTIELLLLNGANPTLAVPCDVFLAPPVFRTPLQILRDNYPNDHESISLLERAAAEPTRTFWLSKARLQTDAVHSLTKVAQDTRGTTEEKRAVCVAKAPVYLKERVAGDGPLPWVKLSDEGKKQEMWDKLRPWKVGEKKNREGGKDGEEEKLSAVLRYVLQAQEEEEEKEQGGGGGGEKEKRDGGMLPEVFVGLMEMMAPKWDPIRGEA
jgi:ankyrin repeat protein